LCERGAPVMAASIARGDRAVCVWPCQSARQRDGGDCLLAAQTAAHASEVPVATLQCNALTHCRAFMWVCGADITSVTQPSASPLA